jgi:hypothetical protein
MKKFSPLLMASILCFLYALMCWGQDKAEAPVLRVGDIWTYQTASGGSFKLEVAQVTDEGYVIALKGTNTSNIFDPKTLNLKFSIAGSNKTKAEGPWRNALDFPIFVGKKWEHSATQLWRGNRIVGSTYYHVEALEDVQTPAGTFKAFRILAKSSLSQTEKRDYWMKLWYSPEVKFWIKREWDKDIKLQAVDAVLAGYKLKER